MVDASPIAALPPSHRLLLGTAGTGTTWGVLVALREHWGAAPYVVATDMAPRHLVAASVLADAFAQVPAVSDPAFEDQLLGLVAEHGIDTYLPTFDGEIVIAARLRDAGRLDGVQVLAAPTWAAETCWDKLRAAQHLAAHGLPAPATRPLTGVVWDGTPFCAKPRHGVGSVGVRVVRSARDLDDVLAAGDPETMVAQDLLRGPEITLDGFRDPRDGWTRVLCRERVEVKAGVSVKARVFENGELARIGADVAAGLELGGAYCLQVMRDAEDRRLVTDVNPRPGAGTRLSAAVGVDFQAAMLAHAWGEDARRHLPALDRERWVARQYRELVLD